MKPVGYLIALFLSCTASSSVVAQTVQHGVIQEYNEKAKKTSLPGVELMIRSAGSTVSDSDGKFALRFLTLKPGERVNVRRIEKNGYEIFNKEAVEQWNINPQTPFVIVMCRSDRFKRIRDNYERVSSESYRRQLQKEEDALARLKREGKLKEEEFQRRYRELYENYERQLDNLENYVDRFTRIDLSELSETEQEIIELVQQGRIDEAISRYEQQNYADLYTQQAAELKEVSSAIGRLTEVKQAKEESCRNLLAALERQIETLKLAGGKENFDKVKSLLHQVAYADTTNADTFRRYTDFLRSQNLFAELYREIEVYLKIDLTAEERLNALESKLIALINLRNFAEGERVAAEMMALVAGESAAGTFRAAELSHIYSGIGGLYMECDHPEKAADYFRCATEAAPEIRPDSEPQMLNISLRARIGLAVSKLKTGDKESAADIVSDLYQGTQEYFASNEPSAEQLVLAKVITDLAQSLEIIRRFDAAVSLYAYSKAIYDDAMEHNPDRIIPMYAQHRCAEAIFHQRTGNYSECEKCYLEAIGLYDKASGQGTSRFEPSVRTVYNNLSSLYIKLDDTEKAMYYAARCFEIAERNYVAEPQYYKSSYRSACVNLARAYDAVGDMEQAGYYYQTAYETDSRIYEEIGETYKADFWRNSLDLPLYYIKNEMYEEAIPVLTGMVSLGETFIDESSAYYEPHLSLMFFLGKSYRIAGRYDEGKPILARYLSIRPDRFAAHLEMARVYAYLGNADKAREHVGKAVELNPKSLDSLEDGDILRTLIVVD
ncbi:MAG: tetratricopeptide repeat protein [Muribaculaceae bacterium]|nr:tetratricopeptide repeat protein [Muribaculaceae bacterium]